MAILTIFHYGNIAAPTISDDSLAPASNYYGTKAREKFDGSCFKRDKITFNRGKVVNIYIVYEEGASGSNEIDHIPKDSLSGAVRLTKHADIDKYQYSGYGIRFDRRSSFLFASGGFGQNVKFFGVDISSSTKIDHRNKYILILGRGPTGQLEHMMTAEKSYSINFTVTKNRFYLSLHCNGANSYLFANGKKFHKFKAKESEIVANKLCLRNISKHWSVDNMKRSWIKRIFL